MNYKAMLKILGQVLKYEAILMIIPLIIAGIYRDGDFLAFLLTIFLIIPISYLLCKVETENDVIYPKEGFFTVGIAWIIISVVGAIPFMLSGAIPNFIDAFFETVSGFTTTGATILSQVEGLPRGILFWRSFTHFIGGMGFLVLILSLMPSMGSTNTIHLLKAESPGPTPGKIVPKIKQTAIILYIIYSVMTIIETILLVCSGMSVYDALIHALGTAGTGGFSNMNSSVAAFHSPIIEWIITIFMLLFGVNFALYFQLLEGNVKNFFKNEELRYYFIIVFSSIVLITINILGINGGNVAKSVRDSAFQVSSIITTTGYATADFNLWPTFSKIILLILMLMGAMAGSTGGGIKTIRIVIMFKAIKREINKLLHPRRVQSVKIDGRTIEENTISGVFLFIGAYAIVGLIAIFIVALDNFDFTTTITSVIATLSNIGPGLELVGPTGNFGMFSGLSKVVLSFCMLAGRLEFYPMLILFSPSLWRKKY